MATSLITKPQSTDKKPKIQEPLEVRANTLLISPEMAKTWIENQGKNRHWRREIVNKYKAEMLAGMWRENGQPIIFDDNGSLVDGQHRLRAIMESNRAIKCLVVSNVKPIDAMTIDMGLSRTLGDLFVMNRLRNARLLSRTSKLLLIWTTKFNELTQKKTFTREIMNVHPQQVYAYYLQHRLEIDRICGEFKNHTPLTANISGAVLAFIYATLEKIDDERCYVFMGSFVTGNIKAAWPYMLTIRDALLSRKKQSGFRLTETERISVIFGIWNVIYHGASVEEVEANTLNIPLELLKHGPI